MEFSELQLKAEHKPVKHIAAWQSNALKKFADIEKPTPEMPRLIFRRDAKLSLTEERKIRLNDVALGLLFHEAHHNYIRGLYPCREQDDVFLAAIYLQIIRGNYDPKADKQFLSR